MTIFDYIKDICVSKRGNLPLPEYVPYLMVRWLSFINPTIATVMNACNKQVLLEDKDLHYKMMIGFFPKLSHCPRIRYMKKTKEKETEESMEIAQIAARYEISKREAKQMLDLINQLD